MFISVLWWAGNILCMVFTSVLGAVGNFRRTRGQRCAVAHASSFTESRSLTEFSAQGILAYYKYIFFYLSTEFLIPCERCLGWG